MKRVFLKIIKEDASKIDKKEVIKNKTTNFIIAGDSIAVSMIAARPKELGTKSSNTSAEGGQSTPWVLSKLTAQLKDLKNKKNKDESWFANAGLIIIAGTNDAHGYGMTGTTTFLTRAIKNVKQMIQTASDYGIKKITVMSLKKLEKTPESLGPWVALRKRKKWMPQERTAQQALDSIGEFVEKFNKEVAATGVPMFEMVSLAPDGVHAAGGTAGKLLDNAKSALGEQSSIIIPIKTGELHSSDPSKTCSVNDNCNCVDTSISGEVNVTAVQRSLKLLGINVKETGQRDAQTQKAIMNFQKSQQEKGFKPPDGREFLRCDGCVGTNTMAAINQELSSQKKTLQGMLSPDELVKIKKRRVRILKSMSGSGKTLEDVRSAASSIGCHPDLVVLACVLHSEPTYYGRWLSEGFAVFNVIVNRIQACGPGRGPHFTGTDSGSKAWNICLNTSSTMGNQSGFRRPFASKNWPSNLEKSVEKVRDFCKKRLSEGSNIGSGTFFFHSNFQASAARKTKARIEEFGSLSAAKEACVREHSDVGIVYKGMKTQWPRKHPLRSRWRGFAYGKSPQDVRDRWSKNYGVAPKIKTSNAEDLKKLKRSTIEVFGNKTVRKNWSSDAYSDSQMKSYLNELLQKKEPNNV